MNLQPVSKFSPNIQSHTVTQLKNIKATVLTCGYGHLQNYPNEKIETKRWTTAALTKPTSYDKLRRNTSASAVWMQRPDYRNEFMNHTFWWGQCQRAAQQTQSYASLESRKTKPVGLKNCLFCITCREIKFGQSKP